MNVSRRFVLKGMALSGMAGVATAHGVLPAMANSLAGMSGRHAHDQTLVLVGAGLTESPFVAGAQAAAGARLQTRVLTHELDGLLAFERGLRVRGLHVIALLDDATATLALDLARGAGARVQWVGHHAGEEGFSSHSVLSTEASRHCARELGLRLAACGAGYRLHEERQGGHPVVRSQGSPPARHAGAGSVWASDLGYVLASLAGPPAMPAPVSARPTRLDGRFVSFSIAT